MLIFTETQLSHKDIPLYSSLNQKSYSYNISEIYYLLVIILTRNFKLSPQILKKLIYKFFY